MGDGELGGLFLLEFKQSLYCGAPGLNVKNGLILLRAAHSRC